MLVVNILVTGEGCLGLNDLMVRNAVSRGVIVGV